MKTKLLIYVSLILTVFTVSAQNNSYNVSPEIVAKVNDVVWGFDFIGGQAILTQKKGQITLVNLSNGSKQKVIHSIPFSVNGQGGLLDVYVLDERTEELLFTYSRRVSGGYTTALGKGTLRGNRLVDFKEIFRAKAIHSGGRHFGSRIEVDKKSRHIYLTVGERGQRKLAQNLSVHNGKILRLNYDGTPAKNNPFLNKSGALDEIYSYGHRNPQGIYFDSNGVLWSAEFGPKGGDEINIIKSGKNYGWPLTTYGTEYSGKYLAPKSYPGTIQPVAYWTPSISPSGMTVYEGSKYSKWKGDIFLANLSSRHLRRVRIRNGKVTEEEVFFKANNWRIRQVNYDSKGDIYFSTDHGHFVRLAVKSR